MNVIVRARSFASLFIVFGLLCTPLTVLAKKGEKNYRRGLEHELAMQWEKAAEQFALAVAASPSDIEYQLHYRRAIFNASQSYMQRGRSLAEKGDYNGAYNAFRQAYGYDSVNGLAVSEMERMLRLQRAKEGLAPASDKEGETDTLMQSPGVTIVPTAHSTSSGEPAHGRNGQKPLSVAPVINARPQQLRVINYNGELEPFIRKLAEELNLNVVFDKDFAATQKRNINIHWRDVTTAQALDWIFQSYGLFFQRLGRRAILVADNSKRPQYQQLVLRTFYLFNIEPDAARTLIQQSLPANAGRQPQVTINKSTNSVTVRDTPENVRLIGELLQSVDKERAEVVMEVAIYEVSRTDLLQIGNQIGTSETLGQLGGTGSGVISLGNRRAVTTALKNPPPTALGAAILLPASTLTALQSKDNNRLVFQTQVHAFDDEKSETRIGQKVPVQTAQVSGFGATINNGDKKDDANDSPFGGTGFPVIQYEDTGLTLDFTPKVFPNQDVQVKMVIETKDASITGTGTGSELIPTFSQRRITGTARIPNNRTMMIASIAQDRQTDGRAGLPLLGLIPVVGRLFSAPRHNNTESDVIITMTPRVMRAPNVTPRDVETRPSGSPSAPMSETLEAMIDAVDREDQLALARQLPTRRVIELPPLTETVSYVPTPQALIDPAKGVNPPPASNATMMEVNANTAPESEKTTSPQGMMTEARPPGATSPFTMDNMSQPTAAPASLPVSVKPNPVAGQPMNNNPLVEPVATPSQVTPDTNATMANPASMVKMNAGQGSVQVVNDGGEAPVRPVAGATAPPIVRGPVKPISGGVLNGKALSIPLPRYPEIAKLTRTSGTVTVEVVVDVTGKVIAARATGGPTMLHQAAETAARQARFTPTILSGQPVKISGIINYLAP